MKKSNNPTDDKVQFDSEEFIKVGSRILEENKVPEEIMMSVVTNTPVGIDLFLIGLARDQTSDIQRFW